MSEETGPTKRRLFKLINNEIIFGDIEPAPMENGQVEILIKHPYTIIGGSASPYMYNIMGTAPGAIQIHPINVLWSVPLDEFETVNNAYIQATTGIITDTKQTIINGL